MASRYRTGSTFSLNASAHPIPTTCEERARENATMRSAVAAPMAAPAVETTAAMEAAATVKTTAEPV